MHFSSGYAQVIMPNIMGGDGKTKTQFLSLRLIILDRIGMPWKEHITLAMVLTLRLATHMISGHGTYLQAEKCSHLTYAKRGIDWATVS